MIFVTVGTQLPFDRLVTAVDDWAEANPSVRVVGQIGNSERPPRHVPWRREMTPAEYRQAVEEADVVVAHAGMGSMITAIEAGKPIVIMPRLAAHHEVRNDHQVGTCNRFFDQPNVFVAWNEGEVAEKIEAALACPSGAARELTASEDLLGLLSSFLEESERRLHEFDGVLFFGGGDWWSLNGDSTAQLVEELSRRFPVLYVNSPDRSRRNGRGVAHAGRRGGRKNRGFTRIHGNLAILDSATLSSTSRARFTRSIRVNHAKDAIAWMGIRKPLIWVANPAVIDIVAGLPMAGLIYQRPNDSKMSSAFKVRDLQLKQRADLTVFGSRALFDGEREECASALYLDGVSRIPSGWSGTHTEAATNLDDDGDSPTRARLGSVSAVLHALESRRIAPKKSLQSVAVLSEGDHADSSIGTGVEKPGATPSRSKARYWRPRHFVGAALLALAGVFLTADAWTDMFNQALHDEESSHILLVLPAAAWLAWVRKDRLQLALRSQLMVGPLLVAAGGVLYGFGDTELIQTFWYLGAIAIVAGGALSTLGGDVLRRSWPAFAVLLFLIPIPGLVRQQISIPLQTITAKTTAFILETLGTPVTLSGNVLVVNDVSVGIAEACNGIRMVFALALVCYLYAFGTSFSPASRLLILVSSPLVALGANIVRLIPTVWLFGYTNTGLAETFHDLSGWAMMPIALGGLMVARGVVRWAWDGNMGNQERVPAPVFSRSMGPPSLG